MYVYILIEFKRVLNTILNVDLFVGVTSTVVVVIVVVNGFLIVLFVGRLAIVLSVARMLGYAVVATVVYDSQLLEHVTSDRGLDGPIVAVGGFVLAVQSFDVDDFRVEPFQYHTDVLDGQMFILFAGQLVDEQQKFIAGHRVIFDHSGLGFGLGTLVGPGLMRQLLLL